MRSKVTEYKVSDLLAVPGHPCYGAKRVIMAKLPEDYEKAKTIAKEVAEERSLDVEICDLSENFWTRASAFFKGIRAPMIVVGIGN